MWSRLMVFEKYLELLKNILILMNCPQISYKYNIFLHVF